MMPEHEFAETAREYRPEAGGSIYALTGYCKHCGTPMTATGIGPAEDGVIEDAEADNSKTCDHCGDELCTPYYANGESICEDCHEALEPYERADWDRITKEPSP